MKYISLHEIVNSLLLQKSYPVHLYLNYLVYAAACLRELNFDTLKQVKTVILEGDTSYDLPCDYIDFVRVGWEHKRCDDFSASVENCDCYGNRADSGLYWRYGYSFGMWHKDVIEISDGKLKVNRDHKLILDYITDGSHIDNATRITPYAQKTIENYAEWQYKAKHRQSGDREVLLAEQQYNKAHDRLRSRLSDLTIEDVKRVIRNGEAVAY